MESPEIPAHEFPELQVPIVPTKFVFDFPQNV